MVVTQGEVYWITLPDPAGSEHGYKRPYVVVQNDSFNKSGLATTVVCAITSSMTHAFAPGNVVLRKGEGGLSKESVVNITQIVTVDKSWLRIKIGKLTVSRMDRILMGVRLLMDRGPTPDQSLSRTCDI